MIYLMTKTKREEFRKTDRFKEISEVISKLNLNSSYVSGNIKNLINKYSNYDDWRKAYFESGEERQSILSNVDNITRRANTDYSYNLFTGKTSREYVPYINEDYGRTKEDICQIAEIIYKDQTEKEKDFSLEEIFAVVYMNIIQIPWEQKERV